jgi:hypothetical protein
MAIVEYDDRVVPSHGDAIGPVALLVNEAPGPSEASSGIPSFGQQGATYFTLFELLVSHGPTPTRDLFGRGTAKLANQSGMR